MKDEKLNGKAPMRNVALMLLLMVTFPLSAEVFKYVDKDGNIVFTDTPPPEEESEEVDLPDIQTSDSYSGSVPRVSTPRSSRKNSQSGEALSISLSPADGETIRANGGEITAVVSLSPEPEFPVSVNFYLDGAKVATSEGYSAVISGLNRGEHTIEAEVTDAGTGRILGRTAPSKVLILRASVLRQKLIQQHNERMLAAGKK